MKNIVIYMLVFNLYVLNFSKSWADELPLSVNFFSNQDEDIWHNINADYGQNLNEELSEPTHRKTYFGEDQLEETPKTLTHNFYQNERFRFYNHTQYNLDAIKDKYAQGDIKQIGLSDLDITLGYGMEFILSSQQSVGYEYLSNFPSTQGQSIRFFWKKIF